MCLICTKNNAPLGRVTTSHNTEFKTVEQFAPNNWKSLFKRLIVPRMLSFSLAAETTFARDVRRANESAAEFVRRDNASRPGETLAAPDEVEVDDIDQPSSESLMVLAETEPEARNDLDWIVSPIPPKLATLLQSIAAICFTGKRHPWESFFARRRRKRQERSPCHYRPRPCSLLQSWLARRASWLLLIALSKGSASAQF